MALGYEQSKNIKYRIQRREHFNITDTWEKQKVQYINRLIDNPINIGAGGAGGGGFSGGWASAVQTMGKWFQDNIHQYWSGGGKRGEPANTNPLCLKVLEGTRCLFACNILPPHPSEAQRKVQNDCSAFVYACLLLYKPDVFPPLAEIGNSPTAKMFCPGNPLGDKYVNLLRGLGFRDRPWTSMEDINPFEIYAGDDSRGGRGHVEICAEVKGKQYGWGGVHDGQNGRAGMPCGRCNGTYTTIWSPA